MNGFTNILFIKFCVYVILLCVSFILGVITIPVGIVCGPDQLRIVVFTPLVINPLCVVLSWSNVVDHILAYPEPLFANDLDILIIMFIFDIYHISAILHNFLPTYIIVNDHPPIIH